MKKVCKVALIIMLATSFILTTGCSNTAVNDEQIPNESQTVAQALASQFKSEMTSNADMNEVAKKLSENSKIKIAVDVLEMTEEDYFAGFTTEINGFKKAYSIGPMISTIPFIAYLFEVDNAEEFANNLKNSADLRWNICTEADNMETAVVGNYVFFVMSPESFE